MQYIGIDPVVGLECSECDHVTRVRYSLLLEAVNAASRVDCEACGRHMRHDWSTVSVVQNIIRRRMDESGAMRRARAGAHA